MSRRFKLGAEDHERLGCPDEWLDVDPLAISIADLEELSERCGFEPSEWPRPLVASPRPRWSGRVTVWLALRQRGIAVSWDEAGSVRAFAMRSEPPEVVDG